MPSLTLKCPHESITPELPRLIYLNFGRGGQCSVVVGADSGVKIWVPPDWWVTSHLWRRHRRMFCISRCFMLTSSKLLCLSYILMSGYLMLKILSPKSVSMSCHPLNIIISINFRNPITHIFQTPSLYQKRIKTRINSKNIRHLKISTLPLQVLYS